MGNTCSPVPALEADQRFRPMKPRAPYFAGACGKYMYQECHDGRTPRYRRAVEKQHISVMVSITMNPDL